MSNRKTPKIAVFSRNSAIPNKTVINRHCTLSRAGKTRVVIPVRRVVCGGWHEVVNGCRVYHVNTRWEVCWFEVFTDWTNRTRIVMRTDIASEWELARVNEMQWELEMAA